MRASATSVLDSDTCNNVDSQLLSSVRATTQKMTRMQNEEEGINYIFRVVHPLLNALGAWPTDVRSSVLSKMRKCIQIVFVYSIEFAVIASAMLYTFLFVKNTSIRVKLR